MTNDIIRSLVANMYLQACAFEVESFVSFVRTEEAHTHERERVLSAFDAPAKVSAN